MCIRDRGYIGEQVKALLLDAGIEHALIDLGGNVLVLGGRPDGTSFKIGIQDPLLPTGTACAAIQVQDTSVVTAGDYERYFEVDGVRYHHCLLYTSSPARRSLSSRGCRSPTELYRCPWR